MIEFKLPSLGADMDQGTLLEWRVKPGDPVKRGDVVALVDTTKAAVDVEIWEAGTVFEILVQPGEKIPVGTVLATLLSPGESSPTTAAPAIASVSRRQMSPAARRRAAELKIDLDGLAGTGPGGAVTLADVEKFAQAAAPQDRGRQMRAAIAAAMSRSKREIPHYYLAETVPLDRAGAWLSNQNLGRPVTGRILMAALFVKAVARAVRDYPEMNGYYRDGGLEPATAAHVGVAISLRGGGLVAPALRDAGDKPLAQVMHELSDLVARARAGSLRSSEVSDPSITVTNLGDQGVESVFGVIYPPQVALVGFGRVSERPWAVDGAVKPIAAVTASLAADHRVSDGHRGAAFLAGIRDLLMRPEDL